MGELIWGTLLMSSNFLKKKKRLFKWSLLNHEWSHLLVLADQLPVTSNSVHVLNRKKTSNLMPIIKRKNLKPSCEHLIPLSSLKPADQRGSKFCMIMKPFVWLWNAVEKTYRWHSPNLDQHGILLPKFYLLWVFLSWLSLINYSGDSTFWIYVSKIMIPIKQWEAICYKYWLNLSCVVIP